MWRRRRRRLLQPDHGRLLSAPAARHVGLQQQPLEIVPGRGSAVVARPVPVDGRRAFRRRPPCRRDGGVDDPPRCRRDGRVDDPPGRYRFRRLMVAQQPFLGLVNGRVQVHGRPAGRRTYRRTGGTDAPAVDDDGRRRYPLTVVANRRRRRTRSAIAYRRYVVVAHVDRPTGVPVVVPDGRRRSRHVPLAAGVRRRVADVRCRRRS